MDSVRKFKKGLLTCDIIDNNVECDQVKYSNIDLSHMLLIFPSEDVRFDTVF